MLVQKIIKHGNSLAVVIPVRACEALAIKRGNLVVLQIPNSETILLNFAAKITYPKTVKELYLEQHHGKRRTKRS